MSVKGLMSCVKPMPHVLTLLVVMSASAMMAMPEMDPCVLVSLHRA